ncbi:MAG: hypothetical protein U1F43_24060 [Myxococcota bacterium]
MGGSDAVTGAVDLELLRRQSGVALGRDGVFTYRGRPVENERVQELFHAGIDVRDDGQVTLTVGRFMAYPDVEGVARFVRRVAWDAAGGGSATLVGGREARFDRGAIAYGPDDRFYVWLDGLRGPAVLLREAHQVLAGRIADDPEGLGRALGWLPAIPGPASPRPTSEQAIAGDVVPGETEA